MLRIIFGPKRKKVTGDWRRLHHEELHKLSGIESCASSPFPSHYTEKEMGLSIWSGFNWLRIGSSGGLL